jgi:hypothetical protein
MLDSLKITECPYAFASFAAKHNALCELLGGMIGQNGITVTTSDRKILLTGGGTGTSGNVDLSGILANISALQTTTSGLTSNVTTLQNLTTGLSRQNVTYCNAGSNTTITILRS